MTLIAAQSLLIRNLPHCSYYFLSSLKLGLVVANFSILWVFYF